MNNLLLGTMFLAAYAAGSIPFGLLIARKVRGIDLREYGSRNIGATNVFRVVGKKWGIFAFFLDACKGYFAVCLPLFFGFPATLAEKLALGGSAILGHTFPIWLAFRGGKGVATSLGVFLAIVPISTAITFCIWLAVFGLARIISVASLAATITFPAVVFFQHRKDPDFFALFIISILLSIFIFYTHRSNIRRLLRGEEKKLF